MEKLETYKNPQHNSKVENNIISLYLVTRVYYNLIANILTLKLSNPMLALLWASVLTGTEPINQFQIKNATRTVTFTYGTY